MAWLNLSDSRLAPTGKLIVGSVFDCNKKRFERLVKEYDRQLYLKWNPKKREGWGMWELRRKPDSLTNIYQGKLPTGQNLYTSEYKEIDIIHHVLDIDHLHDNVLGKLKSIDSWNTKNFIDELDYAATKHKEKEEQSAREELRYNVKQHKREWREFATLVSQGVNPSHILNKMRG